MDKGEKRFLFHVASSTVVPIGRSDKTSPRGGWLLRGPVADKFFLVSALATFFGAMWLGAHLWLMRNGQMPVAVSYVELRRAHIQLQLYLFFGLAIQGFLMQAAPRFLEIPVRPTARALWLIPATVFGALLLVSAPDWVVAKAALALPFVLVMVGIGQLLRSASMPLRRQFGSWILLSLSGFVTGVFFSGMGPDRWLLTFWISVAPMVFGIGQQFIRAFVTGRTIVGWWQSAFPIGFVVGGLLMGIAYLSGSDLLWRLTGGVVGLLGMSYAVQLGLWSVGGWKSRGVLSVAFAVSYAWMILGALLLLVCGATALDAVLHVWALGWVCPLLFSISSQIMENFAGRFLLSRRLQLTLLVLWQLVPFGRAGALLMLPPWMSMLVATVSTLVFLTWGIALGIAASAVWSTQRRAVGA